MFPRARHAVLRKFCQVGAIEKNIVNSYRFWETSSSPYTRRRQWLYGTTTTTMTATATATRRWQRPSINIPLSIWRFACYTRAVRSVRNPDIIPSLYPAPAVWARFSLRAVTDFRVAPTDLQRGTIFNPFRVSQFFLPVAVFGRARPLSPVPEFPP